jgi:hypothetical protein
MKLAKLSLAAIVAAGALTTVNAQPLEEAIKGVDVSGFARYRFENREINSNTDSGSDLNNYDIKAKLVAPVTEDLKFTTVLTYGGDGADSNYKAGGVAVDPDASRAFDVDNMYFTYTNGALTVQAGRQPLGAPTTDNGYRGEKGTGIVALYNLGSVTLAGAFYNTSDITSNYFSLPLDDNEVSALAAIGSFGPVNAQIWGIQMTNTIDHLIFVQVDGQVIDGLTLKGQYINTKLGDGLQDASGAKDDTGDFYGIQADYAINSFAFSAGYTNNDEDQPIHAFATEANTDIIAAGYMLNDDYKNNSLCGGDQYFVNGSYTYGKFGFMLGYAEWNQNNVDGVTTKEEKLQETWGGVSYAYAKNFNTYIKYSDISADVDEANLDQKFLRFEAKYSF